MKIKSLFSIFSDSPNSFDGQREGEEVLMLLRRHPFTIYVRLGLLGLMALVPIFVGLVFYSYIFKQGWGEVFFLASGIWYLGLWLSAFHAITLYTLSTVLITSKRVIDSDQHGLFNREIAELNASRIQDVSTHTNGLIETFLKFGNVTVQTAGSEKQFVFVQIPNPDAVKDIIMQMSASAHTGVKAKTLPNSPVHNLDL